MTGWPNHNPNEFTGNQPWKTLTKLEVGGTATPSILTSDQLQADFNLQLSLETLKILFEKELTYIAKQRSWFVAHNLDYVTRIDQDQLRLFQVKAISGLQVNHDAAEYEPNSEPSRFITLKTSTALALFPREIEFLKRHKYRLESFIELVNTDSLTLYSLFQLARLMKQEMPNCVKKDIVGESDLPRLF
jgi:hypothetical protein